MKVFLLAGLASLLSLVSADDDCPEEKQVNCVDDTKAAYGPCKKAAINPDVPATLECLKYYAKMRKDCWPCICMIAHEEHWDIQGCWMMETRNSFKIFFLTNMMKYKKGLLKKDLDENLRKENNIVKYNIVMDDKAKINLFAE